MLHSYALFRRVFEEVAAVHLDVAAGYLYADAAAHEVVADPEWFQSGHGELPG